MVDQIAAIDSLDLRASGLDAIEAVDAHVFRVGKLRRQPRRQPALDVDVAHQLGVKRMGIRS